MREPLAVLTSDWHLSDKTPVARRVPDEQTWNDVQFGYVWQVRELCKDFKIPLVIAGDLFDRPKVSPEVVNSAISTLRLFSHGVYAIPGQHDLPFHRYDDIEKSSYWTLVKAGVITHLDALEGPEDVKGLSLHGIPWGLELPKDFKPQRGFNLAVVHAYCWKEGHSYPGVTEDSHDKTWAKKLKGFTAAVFGDNHHHFISKHDNLWLLNCGSLIRRRADEINLKPSVGILYSDGSIERHKLDTSKDQWAEVGEELVTGTLNAESFLETLGELGEISLDFAESVRRFLNKSKAGPLVRKFILEALEDK